MAELSEIYAIHPDDNAEFLTRANQRLDKVKAIVPEELHSLLVCAVTKDGTVNVDILGSAEDIAKMLGTVVTVARNGVVQANTPPNPSNEVTH